MHWKQARSRSERALIAAAIVQHEFAKAVRAQLRRPNTPVTTTVALAAAADLTID